MSAKDNNSNITCFTTDDYVMPKWSAFPKYRYFFQVLKDGCIVSKIQIKDKQFSLIGRLQDLCDIFIDNPTVSRKHAILQFSQNSLYPLLYDLGNTHGTCVNKEKLPPRIYKKIQPFTNIKFGISSRSYILRCPQLQQRQMIEQEQKQNQFVKTLETQNIKLSKQQIKQKYLQMLQNDPYSGNQLTSRKFMGKNNQKNIKEQIDGIDWGISDQNQIYGYKNDQQFPIQTDIIRRLPGLDQIMLDKLADYQQKLRVYQQIQNELNQLANKEKREFGLQEKLQNKKQKLQKKFVQSVEALQKSEHWIRENIFGDQSAKTKKAIGKTKQKQIDTFSDDQFYDRTLQDKHKKNEILQNKAIQGHKDKKQLIQSVQDFWEIKKIYQQKLKKKKELQSSAVKEQLQQPQRQPTQQNKLHQAQQDELEAFMKETNQKLLQEKKDIQNRQLTILQTELQILKTKLIQILGQKQLKKIQAQVFKNKQEKILTKQQKLQIKKKQDAQRLQKTFTKLAELEKQKELENISQEDVNIFKYYQPSVNQKSHEEDEQMTPQQDNYKRSRNQIQDHETKIKKKIKGDSQSQQIHSQSSEQQQNVYDLTKFS